jgi:hypothetical protein
MTTSGTRTTTAASHVAFTDMLYGDDISKNVKEIQDVNRDGKKIGKFPASNFINFHFIKLIRHFYNINRSFDNDMLVLLYTDVIRLSIWT